MDDIMDQHCALGTKAQSGKLKIHSIVNHPLGIVVYTIGKVAGTRSSHLTTRSHMLYALQCMERTIFNWCESMLMCLKKQLTKCRRGTLKQFGYGAMLVSFILHWISHLRPHVTITRLEPEDPTMIAWDATMPCLGGAMPKVSYGARFFKLVENPIAYDRGLCL